MVKPEMEAKSLGLLDAWIAKIPGGRQGEWNYDIRLSVETNMRLILDAGCSECTIQFYQSGNGSDGPAVLRARV